MWISKPVNVNCNVSTLSYIYGCGVPESSYKEEQACHCIQIETEKKEYEYFLVQGSRIFFITYVLDESEVFSKYSYLHQLRKYARISDSVSK